MAKIESKIKVIQIFEEYPLFYQPYIPPVITEIQNSNDFDIKIIAFKGKSSSEVQVMPSYYLRRIIERWYGFVNRNQQNLAYNEILAIKNNAHIIHLQHAFLFPKILGLANSRMSIMKPKLIVTLRGTETYARPYIQKKWKDFFYKYGTKIDAYVVMSDDHKSYLMRWGVPKEKIHIIPISFGETFQIQPKIPNNKCLQLVSVFRLCWEKNINGNLLVAKHLKSLGVKFKYTIIGDGEELMKVHYLIDKYQLNDFVEVLGRIENSNLKMKLKSYDIILQLSHLESLGMSIIEAQSMGIPAIVSNTGGLPEAVIDNVTGFVVDANDYVGASKSILKLWQNKDCYFKFSKGAIEHAQSSFSIKVESNRLKNLYKSLINK
ncbi:glycosyltransferase family 4 protein [Winogradskyella maritima]|uniref:Glycosyltransferase family 4 protein n=1 Tax=Winogradskyella maritima TaxID=1517766 RepID=A0ABV8AI34_9FLAO|nr:glycosyltransferase family 4 protein [Winogradskyella maritima]